MEFIEGSVCAARGFSASGVHCGIRKNRTKPDLALIVSETTASAAAVYTKNLVKGAPISVTKKNISDGKARAMICNSGNANTCNADGLEIAEKMCSLVERYAGIPANDVIVASTGVIGQPLNVSVIEGGMSALVSGLSANADIAAEAIMTTDTKRKEAAVSFMIGDKECRMGGIAKGSGMIHPNMATMLVFITSDVAISPEMLSLALSEDVKDSFNMISVDGDTSTNDMVSVLSNGMAGNRPITGRGKDFDVFCKALSLITKNLCRKIAADGEGATRLIECRLAGASDEQSARTAARAVVSSSLVKAAMFGSDANWGRVLCAIGYSGIDTDPEKIDVSFESANGRIEVCRNGSGVDFSEEIAKKILTSDEVVIDVSLNAGNSCAVAWGCDLTYDYVKINGDYRT